jgi:hypothetical protein
MNPRCQTCRKVVTSDPRWLRYSDGKIHLAFWCCGHQVNLPISRTQAYRWNLESFEQARARLTVANDVKWSV